VKASELGLRRDRCLCRTCGELFNSTAAFDAHRTGRYDIHVPRYGRRCLADDEMLAKGMARNSKGFWLTPRKQPRKAHGTPAYPPSEPTSTGGRYIGSDPPPDALDHPILPRVAA
jgi:hypothetical protein